MRTRLPLLVLTLMAAGPGWAAATYEECQATVEVFRGLSNTSEFLAKAYGYAVFPTIGKGAALIGGAYGTGCVYRGGAKAGTVSMGQLTVGFQLGGQVYSELIVFQNKNAYDSFTSGSFEFGADATAVALTYGAQAGTGTTGSSASAGTSAGNTKGMGGSYRGMVLFTVAKGGLMYEVSVGGQKFNFQPIGLE